MKNTKFDVKMVNGRTDIDVLEASYFEKMQEARKSLPEEFDFVLKQNQLGASVEEAFQTMAKSIVLMKRLLAVLLNQRLMRWLQNAW